MGCGHRTIARITSDDGKTISILGCCAKNVIRTVDIESLNKADNIIEFLNEVHSEWNYETNTRAADNIMCNDVKVCDFDKYDINRVEVSTLHTCNLACPMCEVHTKAYHNSKELYFSILNKILGHKLYSIGLTMEGEPFIYKKETLDYISKLTLDDTRVVEIITNGTLLEPEDIKKLKEISDTSGIRISISVSCDALNKKVYKLTRGKDFFDKVSENIVLLNQAGLLNSILFTVQKPNFRQVKHVKKYWAKRGVEEEHVSIMSVNPNPNKKGDLKIVTKARKLANKYH